MNISLFPIVGITYPLLSYGGSSCISILLLIGIIYNMDNMDYISEEKYRIMGGVKLRSGDILYCLRGSVGKNAIIQAAKLGVSIDGATLYCTHQPCVICAKMIVNSGISRVVYGEGYPDEFALKIFEQSGVLLEKYDGREADDEI